MRVIFVKVCSPTFAAVSVAAVVFRWPIWVNVVCVVLCLAAIGAWWSIRPWKEWR